MAMVMMTFLKITRLVVNQLTYLWYGASARDLFFILLLYLCEDSVFIICDVINTCDDTIYNLSAYMCDWSLGAHKIMHPILSLKLGVTLLGDGEWSSRVGEDSQSSSSLEDNWWSSLMKRLRQATWEPLFWPSFGLSSAMGYSMGISVPQWNWAAINCPVSRRPGLAERHIVLCPFLTDVQLDIDGFSDAVQKKSLSDAAGP